MDKSCRPEQVGLKRTRRGNLLKLIGSIGMSDMSDLGELEESYDDIETQVLDTAYHETIHPTQEYLDAIDAISAKAFEASGLMLPDTDTELELFF